MKLLEIKTVLVLIFASILLSACETIDGAGQDLENAGEAIQDSANGR